jgi:hypothetical protein
MPRRGSDRHNPRQDDDLKDTFEPDERAGRPTRAHEWRDPEVGQPEPGKNIPLRAGADDEPEDED